MPAGTEQLKYFGCGPMETYRDKRQAGIVGVYSIDVTNHFEHYIRPQENMAHTETHWVKITDTTGTGLKISPADSTPDISFNCSHFTAEQLTAAKHDYELIPLQETIVHIDYMQAGIGSNSCGPSIQEKWRLPSGQYSFAFRFDGIQL